VQPPKLAGPYLLCFSTLFHGRVAAIRTAGVRGFPRTSVWRDGYDVEVMGGTWVVGNGGLGGRRSRRCVSTMIKMEAFDIE
jgi:hypothetical protein